VEEAVGHPGRKQTIDGQFGHPTGMVGALVGYAMAIEHKSLHRAVVDKLSLTQGDVVLEIGFGPGTAIQLASRQASMVAGIDVSPVMVRQAHRRNRFAVLSGRVELSCASAQSIPYPDERFSVVFEVNSLHHWEDPDAGIREVYRVLKPGGRFLAVLRAGHGESLSCEIEKVSGLLRQQGFKSIRTEEHSLGHGGVFVQALR
jgi:SAM-dependent methyltransferase